MCKVFELSRAGYYAWKRRSKRDNDPRKAIIKKVYIDSKKIYGYRKIVITLREKENIVINHKAVLRIMREIGIRSIARKRKPYPKPNQLGTHHKYENVLNQNFQASHPNQKWVTDITYIRTQQGWAYLSVIKDLYDGYIVAHNVSRSQSLQLVLNTLRIAKQKERVTDGILLHSDQGFQYTSHAYFTLLKEYKISPSMSRRGNCYDNAVIENFFGHFKQEALQLHYLPSFQEVCDLVDQYIYFYNFERIQLKTKQTPYQLRCLLL